MSQDLLSEFDSLYSAPVLGKPPAPIHDLITSSASASTPTPKPKPTPTPIPAPKPSTNRRFTSTDPLNLNLPLAPAASPQQFPLHNVPLVRTSSHTHQHRASATNFDDLLAYVNSPQAPWPPKPPQMTRLGQTQRPVSFHGQLPASKKIGPFDALGNDFSGGDGRGGRFTPPPLRPGSTNSHNVSRKSSPVSQQSGGTGFSSLSTPTPPPDLLDILDGEQKEDGDDDDDFGDFASASLNTTPAAKLASAPALVPTLANVAFGPLDLQSPTNISRNNSSGIQQYGNGLRNSMSTPPTALISEFSFPSATNPTPRNSYPEFQQDRNALRNDTGTPSQTSMSGFGFPLTAKTTPPRNGLSGLQQNGGNYRRSMGTPPKPPTPPKMNHIKNISIPTPVDDDDDFGEFITSPVTATPPSQSIFNTPPPRTLSTPPPMAPPDTNRHSITLKNFTPINPPTPKKKVEDIIPPVYVLLTAFPPLFLLPQTHLLDKLTSLPFPLRQRVLSHSKTREFLEGTCEIGRVAGRIISGRRRRTKSTLSSSRNRANSKGSGGMKLGIGGNSNWEQQKEEREVKEICRLWGDGAGRLKAAMGAGVPELVDEVGRSGPGIKVVDGCRLCRLGKEELIIGLKESTERMGWWDAGWGGHGGCRGFWEKHGKALRG